MRMRRVQRIMSAVKTHQKIAETIKNKSLEKGSPVASGNKKMVSQRVKSIKGRISSSKKRTRDLWTRAK